MRISAYIVGPWQGELFGINQNARIQASPPNQWPSQRA